MIKLIDLLESSTYLIESSDIDLITLAKSIKFPTTNVKNTTNALTWNSRGGYRGERVIKRVIDSVKSLNWKKVDGNSADHPAGNWTEHSITYADKSRKFYVSLRASYGSTKEYNSYEIKLFIK